MNDATVTEALGETLSPAGSALSSIRVSQVSFNATGRLGHEPRVHPSLPKGSSQGNWIQNGYEDYLIG